MKDKKQDKSKVCYITGAVIGMEKKGDIYEVELHDNPGTFFFTNLMGVRVGNGYKFGIIDTPTKNRYEIVSIKQPILTDPAFRIKGPQGEIAQMKASDYRELVSAKHCRIRNFAIEAAIKICKHTTISSNAKQFKKEVLEVARDLEPYFE